MSVDFEAEAAAPWAKFRNAVPVALAARLMNDADFAELTKQLFVAGFASGYVAGSKAGAEWFRDEVLKT